MQGCGFISAGKLSLGSDDAKKPQVLANAQGLGSSLDASWCLNIGVKRVTWGITDHYK